MALLDQYGKSIRYQAASGAERYSNSRPWEPVQLKDIDQLVPPCDRMTLLSASRRLFLNMGAPRGAIEQKAMYSVGRSWAPKFEGTDLEFGTEATAWLSGEWYGIGDIRGGMHDFRTGLYLMSVAIDRDGEVFVLLTETETGYPRYQIIPAHRIASAADTDNDGKIKGGEYKGLLLLDGIAYNKNGVAVAVCYTDDCGEFDSWLSLRDVIHLYDPSWQEQGRGLPAFTHAINDLRDSLLSHEWERQAQLMISSIGLIERNDLGGPDPGDPGTVLAGDTSAGNNSGVTMQTYSGGAVRYFKSDSGGGIEQLKSERPGAEWSEFQDRIIRSSLAGINWPYSMVWKATGQGTAERSDLGKAQRAVEDRQDILEYAAKRLVGYAVAKGQKLGKLAESADWWKWSFTYPRKLTIDDGRVAKEIQEMWRAGVVNHEDIIEMFGSDPATHYQKRAREIGRRKMVAIDETVAAKAAGYDIEILDTEMAMLAPAEISAEATKAQINQSKKEDDDDSTDD